MLLTYSLRSLVVQRTAVLPTIFGVMLAVALVGAMTLVIQNVENTLLRSGRSDNIVVIGKQAFSLWESEIPFTETGRLKLLPGIEKQGEQEMVSAEQLVTVRARRSKDQIPFNIDLRGVDPIAYQLHDRVHIESGTMPAEGQPGLLVGVASLNRYDGVAIGGSLRVGRTRWPVVGTFSAPGTTFEDQLWCDRTALGNAYARTANNGLIMRVKGGEPAIQAINQQLATMRELNLEAITEVELSLRRYAALAPFITVAWAMTVVLMLGASFASVSTIHALLLKRMREFATLLAIGFTRGQIIGMLVFESSLLVLGGALAGFLISSTLVGTAFHFKGLNMFLRLLPVAKPALYSALVAVAVVVVSVGIAVVEIRRMVVLEALRTS